MRKVMKNISTTFLNMDKVLFFSTLILIVFGTLNIVTASSREAVVNSSANMFHFFFKHMGILFISLTAFLILINLIKTKDYKKWMLVIFPIILALNAYLVLKGGATRGASNWINLKVIKIQPSEFAKPVLIITMSILFSKFYKKLNSKKEKNTNEIWYIIGIPLVLSGLVFLQKDLGTALILMGIFAVEFIFSPVKKEDKYKAGFAILLLLAVCLVESCRMYCLVCQSSYR